MPQVHSYGQFLNRSGGPYGWDSPTGSLRSRISIVAKTSQGGGQSIINVKRTNGITGGSETATFDPFANIMTVEAAAIDGGSTVLQIRTAIEGCLTYGANTLIDSTSLEGGTVDGDTWTYETPGTGSTCTLSDGSDLDIVGNLDTEYADVTNYYTITLVDGASTSTPEVTVNDANKVITVAIQDGVTTHAQIETALENATVNGLVEALEVTVNGGTTYTLGNGVDSARLDGGESHTPDTVTLSPLWHEGFDFQVDSFGFPQRTPYANPAGYAYVPEEGDLIADEFGMVWEVLGTSYNDSTGTPIPNPTIVSGTRYNVNIRGASQYHSEDLGTPIPTGSAKCLISKPSAAGLVTFFNKSAVAWNSNDGAAEYNFRNLNPTVDLSGIRGGPPCLEGQELDTMQKIVQSIGGQYDYDTYIKGGVPVDGDTLNKLYLMIGALREVDLKDAIDVGKIIDRDYDDTVNPAGTYESSSGDVIGIDTATGSTASTVTILLPGHGSAPSNNDTVTVYSINDWSVINPIVEPGTTNKIRGLSDDESMNLDFGARVHFVFSSEADAWLIKL